MLSFASRQRQSRTTSMIPHRLTGLLLAILCCGILQSRTANAQTSSAEPTSPIETPCMDAFLTGVGGPAPQHGKAQSGVFIRYGTQSNGCDDVRIQFDAGRGTLMRLSEISTKKRPGFVTPQSLNALFITHGHSDHTSSLPDIISTR